MSNPVKLVDQYLGQQHMMQLATSIGGQPWCCSLYYVHDVDRNLYWASWPTRRHSEEIAVNQNVAVAIPIKHTNGEKVIGIQMEGQAAMVSPNAKNRPIVEAYAKKFGRDESWVDDFTAGRNKHQLYKLSPKKIVLFDDVNFPEDPRVTL